MNLPKLNRLLRRIPLHLVVLALTLIWIIPTIGLLVTSFRPVEDINTSGWWTVFSRETKTSTAYDQWCSSCHGEGQDVAGVDLSDPAVVSELNSALRLLAFMRRGHPDISQNGQMPTSQEAADIAATLQGLTGEEESARFTLDNYIDALVGYRGLQTYTSDCADGTPPSGFTCNFLRDLGNRRGMGRAFVNSLLVTIPATILPILFAGFAAYAFAWMDFRGRQVMFAILVALQVVPLQMTLVPIFRIYSQLGLNGTFLGVWLFHTGFGMPYAIYLMRNFLGGLPRDLFEVGLPGRRLALDGLRAPGHAAGHARHRIAGHFPVPLGVERPAGGPGLPGLLQPGGHLPDLQHGHLAGRGLAAADGGGIHLHDPAADRLLRLPALLRARHAGRGCERVKLALRSLSTAGGNPPACRPLPERQVISLSGSVYVGLFSLV